MDTAKEPTRAARRIFPQQEGVGGDTMTADAVGDSPTELAAIAVGEPPTRSANNPSPLANSPRQWRYLQERLDGTSLPSCLGGKLTTSAELNQWRQDETFRLLEAYGATMSHLGAKAADVADLLMEGASPSAVRKLIANLEDKNAAKSTAAAIGILDRTPRLRTANKVQPGSAVSPVSVSFLVSGKPELVAEVLRLLASQVPTPTVVDVNHVRTP